MKELIISMLVVILIMYGYPKSIRPMLVKHQANQVLKITDWLYATYNVQTAAMLIAVFSLIVVVATEPGIKITGEFGETIKTLANYFQNPDANNIKETLQSIEFNPLKETIKALTGQSIGIYGKLTLTTYLGSAIASILGITTVKKIMHKTTTALKSEESKMFNAIVKEVVNLTLAKNPNPTMELITKLARPLIVENANKLEKFGFNSINLASVVTRVHGEILKLKSEGKLDRLEEPVSIEVKTTRYEK